MSLHSAQLLDELVAEARLAPSIHNIQPARWRLQPDGRLALIDDTHVRAPCADPTGHDVRLSHGAALEGMSLALHRRGLSIADLTIADLMVLDLTVPEQRPSQQYVSLGVLTVGRAGAADPLHDSVARRMSWRGMFRSSPGDNDDLDRVAAARDDVICIRDRAVIAQIARWGDEAELFFLRRDDHRRELLRWMRLSARHPLYRRDGLNREALAMGAVEAVGARFVLGNLFVPLDRLGIAASLISDRGKTLSAAAIVAFHRPRGEDPLLTGRHFYRAWLELDRAGFAACPVSALADHPVISEKLAKLAGIGAERRLVNVFRVGRPSRPQTVRHFRLPVDQLVV